MQIKQCTCCFFGHRKITITDRLIRRLYNIVEELIINKNIDTFLFGSKSEFDKLCVDTVTNLKNKYPYIRRVYVRAEFPCINNDYKKYLSEFYDETYYPQRIEKAGRAKYIERNFEMINNSQYCIIYFDKKHLPSKKTLTSSNPNNSVSKSGTQLAYEYAKKKELQIINLFYE